MQDATVFGAVFCAYGRLCITLWSDFTLWSGAVLDLPRLAATEKCRFRADRSQKGAHFFGLLLDTQGFNFVTGKIQRYGQSLEEDGDQLSMICAS
jgi:hypothetical protein